MSSLPSGLIAQGLTINGQSPLPDPTIQAPTGVGDQTTTDALEASDATAMDQTDTADVSVNGVPLDVAPIADTITL